MNYFLEGQWTTINGENTLTFRPIFNMVDTFFIFINEEIIGMIHASGEDTGYKISIVEIFNESYIDLIPDKIYTETDNKILYFKHIFVRVSSLF